MQAWQVVLLAFFVLLPLVLMLDYWGDERLTTRGRPIPRPWPRSPERGAIDEHASHGDLDETQPPSGGGTAHEASTGTH